MLARTTPFAVYAAHWMAIIAATRSRATVRRYGQVMATHLCPVLGTMSLETIHRAQCRDLCLALRQRGLSPATVRLVLSVLQACLTAAVVDDEVLDVNPALGVRRRLRLPRAGDGNAVRALTLDELRALLARCRHCAPPLAALILTCSYSLRPGEARALQWGDVGTNLVTVRRSGPTGEPPKGGTVRLVEMGDDWTAAMQALPRSSGVWCFPSPRTGLPYDATYLSRLTRRLGQEIGIARLHPHLLRHTAASLWAASGEPLWWISRQLGHQRIDFTDRVYARWLEGRNPEGIRRFTALLRGEMPVGLRLVPGGRHR